MVLDHITRTCDLIKDAERNGILRDADGLSGFSGKKLIGALQRIASAQAESGAGSYLEVGVFQGLTLISVASALGDCVAYGIDNFAQFDPDKRNQTILRTRTEKNNITNSRIINMDYEDALESLDDHISGEKIGTYFVDGPHDYRSQLMCLQLAIPHLSSNSVILVDDCNYPHVRQANRDFLKTNTEFKLLFEAYTECHPGNMDEATEVKARDGWWNGVNIIVRDPENVLKPMYPETIRSRTLFENEHITQSAKYAHVAPESAFFVQSLFSFKLVRAVRQLFAIAKKLRNRPARSYEAMNTDSEKLPSARFNGDFAN